MKRNPWHEASKTLQRAFLSRPIFPHLHTSFGEGCELKTFDIPTFQHATALVSLHGSPVHTFPPAPLRSKARPDTTRVFFSQRTMVFGAHSPQTRDTASFAGENTSTSVQIYVHASSYSPRRAAGCPSRLGSCGKPRLLFCLHLAVVISERHSHTRFIRANLHTSTSRPVSIHTYICTCFSETQLREQRRNGELGAGRAAETDPPRALVSAQNRCLERMASPGLAGRSETTLLVFPVPRVTPLCQGKKAQGPCERAKTIPASHGVSTTTTLSGSAAVLRSGCRSGAPSPATVTASSSRAFAGVPAVLAANFSCSSCKS